MYSERSFFPMLGVGVFYIMFWIGFVVGHNLGFSCDGMLVSGLLFGAAGSYAVVKLERLSEGGSRLRPTKEQPASDKQGHSTRPILKPAKLKI